jgi:hypothetical protein
MEPALPLFVQKYTASLQGWGSVMRWAAPAMALALTASAAGFGFVEARESAAKPAYAATPHLAEIVKVY